MPHFELEQWTDFVRGVSGTGGRDAMKEHLASGCDECGRTFAFLRKVIVASRADARCHVPEAWVRQAKAIASGPAETGTELPALLNRLIYDSFRDPMPAGIRSADHTSRQLVYTAGAYSVDLCLERERRQLSVVGQVANGSQLEENVKGLPVLLLSGNRVLASDVSNTFGEFHLESPYAPHLRLCVLMFASGNRIDLPLPALFGWQERHGGLL